VKVRLPATSQRASIGESGQGRIPNLAVAAQMARSRSGTAAYRSRVALFSREGLAYAMIETMAQNDAGQHLYPACGFTEVARQIHFARKL
jgi:ribosomal protein S18 acetylase RimI-like enzyme